MVILSNLSQHKPGVRASEADNAPEFHAQAVPSGTAPAEDLYQPNPSDEVPPLANRARNADPESGTASAADTLGGATSADVHTGLGHPGQGQTSTELRHEGQHTASKQGTGLVGKASTMNTGGVYNDGQAVDQKDPGFANQRALDKEQGDMAGQRGNIGGPAAEERLPETSETVAAEAPRDR